MAVDKKREYHVLGPPGTGKTTYLSKQIESAQRKHGDQGVVVVSFTRAAAAEIAGRVGYQEPRQGGRGYRGGGYSYNPDEPTEGRTGGHSGTGGGKRIGTLHSLCYHAIERPEIADTHAAKFNEGVPEQYRITGASNSTKKAGIDEPDWSTAGKLGDQLHMSVQKLRARMVEPKMWPMAERDWFERWCAWKTKNDLLDFTDLIEQAIARNIPPPVGCRVGIVDEAQDFTALELTLVRRWAEHLETTVIAYDDDQSLYAFKGARADVLVSSLPDEDHRRVLAQSYRVPRVVHELASRWIEQIEQRAPKEYKPRDFEGSLGFLNGTTSRRPESLVDLISEDIDNGKSVMILAACSYMLAPTITHLRKNGIPFHNPYRVTRGDWNPLRRGGGSVSTRLGAFLQRNVEFVEDEADAILHLWTAKDAWSFAEHLDARVFSKRGAKAELKELATTEGESLITDDEFFKPEHLPWLTSGDIEAFEAHLLNSKAKAYDFATSIAKMNPKLLNETPKVVVGTIHSVKGGEADVVYVFPDLSPEGMRHWLSPHGARGRDDIRRLFYVAFTRARERLVLCQRATPLAVEWEAE